MKNVIPTEAKRSGGTLCLGLPKHGFQLRLATLFPKADNSEGLYRASMHMRPSAIWSMEMISASSGYIHVALTET